MAFLLVRYIQYFLKDSDEIRLTSEVIEPIIGNGQEVLAERKRKIIQENSAKWAQQNS